MFDLVVDCDVVLLLPVEETTEVDHVIVSPGVRSLLYIWTNYYHLFLHFGSLLLCGINHCHSNLHFIALCSFPCYVDVTRR